MKATFTEREENFNYHDRKERHFYEQFSAIVFDKEESKMYEAVTIRIYSGEARSYSCIWTRSNCSWEGNKENCDYWRTASGHASGYGYHRASAAVADAIYNAGIDLDFEVSGRGNSAIEDAALAIAREIWQNEERYIISIFMANA